MHSPLVCEEAVSLVTKKKSYCCYKGARKVMEFLVTKVDWIAIRNLCGQVRLCALQGSRKVACARRLTLALQRGCFPTHGGETLLPWIMPSNGVIFVCSFYEALSDQGRPSKISVEVESTSQGGLFCLDYLT